MLASAFLPRWAITFMRIACTLLSERFSNLNLADAPICRSFEALALVVSGLFFSEVLRNRRLRLASQEQLRVLAETSPAAIVAVASELPLRPAWLQPCFCWQSCKPRTCSYSPRSFRFVLASLD